MPQTLEDQIAAMMGMATSSDGGPDDTGDNEPKPDSKPPQSDAPRAGEENEVQGDNPPKEDGPKDGEPKDPKMEAVATDEDPPTDDSDDPTAALKQEIEDLRQKLEATLKASASDVPAATEDPITSMPTYDPVGDADVDEIIADAGSFKKWASKAFGDFQSQMVEHLKSALPALVQAQANEAINSYDKAREFYDANSDLKPYKSFVGQKFKEVIQANKDKSVDDVLKIAAEQARKELKLSPPKPGKDQEKAKNSLPKRGASSSSRSKGKDELTGVDKEIDAMLAAIDL